MDFPIRGDFIELCKLLKAANLVMTGGEGKELVASGLVKVDGQVETRKRCKIRPGQLVEIEDTQLRVVEAGTGRQPAS